MRQHVLQICTLVTVGVLTYLCATQAGFLAIDDVGMVHNITSNDYTLGSLFFSGANEYYRPLTVISYYANASFTGIDPFYFHLVNVVIHIANSLLVYWFAVVLFVRREDANFLAMLSSLFFLVSPLNSEAASWVSARPDLLCTFFFLLALVLLVKVRDQVTFSSIVCVGVAYLASLCAKEASIAMAAIAPLYLFSRARRERLKEAVLLATAVLATTALYLFLRSGSTLSVDKGVKSVVASAVANGSATTPSLLDAVGAFGFYLQKLLFPFPLNFTILRYDRPVAYLALVAGFLAAWYLLRRNRDTLLPLLIVFIGIVPAVLAYLGRIPWTPFGERYLYLPMIGFSLLVALALSRLKPMPRIVPVACLMLLAIPTMARVALWCDPDAFWKDALKKGPGLAKSYSALGAFAFEQQRFDDAERYMKESLSLSEEPLVWQNLGRVYAAKKDMKKYEDAMVRAASLSPHPTGIYQDLILGLMSGQRGEEGRGAVNLKAVQYHLLALSKDPTYLDAYYHVGKLYLAGGDRANAKCYFALYLSKSLNGYYRPFAQKMLDKMTATGTT